MGDVSASAPIRNPLIALALVAGATAVTLLWRPRRVVVHGMSMAPTLLPGDRLLVMPARKPRCGDVIAVPDPRGPERLLVKRIVGVDSPGFFVLVAGDNPDASTGSASFGPVRWPTVVGRVVYRYWPLERAAPVRRPSPRRRAGSGVKPG